MLGRELCTGLLEPTSPSNEELPRRRLEAVGPKGRLVGLLGSRPLSGPTDLLLCSMGCPWGPFVAGVWLSLVLTEFLLLWPFDPCAAISD